MMLSWLRFLSRFAPAPKRAAARRKQPLAHRGFRPTLERLEDRAVPSLTPLISGLASVEQEAPYTLHLSETGASASTIQSWTINWGDGSAAQTVTGDPSSVTHIYALGDQTFTISASATDATNTSYPTLQNVAVNVVAPVVINFTSGTATHLVLPGGVADPDRSEYTSYVQNGFIVTPDMAVDGIGAHFHLADGALYTHFHDDEEGGPGVTVLQSVDGSPFMLDSLVVPQLDNTAGGGSLTFTDSNGDSMTVTAAGTYQFNWGPITSFTITPNNILDSVNERGYVDSIAVAPVTPPATLSPVINKDTASPLVISGAASVIQDATYTLHLANPGLPARTVQSWTINWGDGTVQTVTGDPSSVTHVYTSGSQTDDITATAIADATVVSSITGQPVTYQNSYLALQKIAVNVITPVVKPTISGAAAVEQEATYTLHLAETGAPAYTIQGWTINWGDGSAPQTVTGDPSTVTHVYTEGQQTFTISATATYADNSYAALDNVAVDVVAPVVINFTSGTATHLQLPGGVVDPDRSEYTSYVQSGFVVTPNAAIDGTGAHFHLANGAMYTHVHDDEPGGAGVVDLGMQSGAAFILDSLVVPQLDNAAGGGSLTFTDSNGDSMTVTAAGTYQFNWGPITSFTITPNNLLDSLNQRGYVDSIAVAPVARAPMTAANFSDSASPVAIGGAASVLQEGTYTLHLGAPIAIGKTIQSWTINWGDGSALQTVTGDPSTVTHVYTTGAQTYTISATANANVTVTSSIAGVGQVTYQNSYFAGNVKVAVAAPVLINFTSGTAVHLQGGAPDEYTSYTQDGFDVVPDAAVDGEGAHFHLANGAMYTHVHDDELGGPGVTTLQDQDGGSYFMVDTLVVPELDNIAGGGSLTFTGSNGQTLTVYAAGTYTLDWGPIYSLTITPSNLLDSLNQRGYVDSITVSPVS